MSYYPPAPPPYGQTQGMQPHDMSTSSQDYSQAQIGGATMQHPLGAPPPARGLAELPPPPLHYPPAPSTKARPISTVSYAFPMRRMSSGGAGMPPDGSSAGLPRHSSDFPPSPAYPAAPGGAQGPQGYPPAY